MGDVETGVREQVGDTLHAIALPACGLADDEALAHLVEHQPRLGRRASGMDDAADDVMDGDRRGNRAERIDAAQRLAAERGDTVAEPPRHAVHRRQHDRVGAEQGPDR